MSIKHSFLALLAQDKATAGQIQARFSQHTDNAWPLNPGQVSQTLSRLNRDGLIAPSGTTIGSNGRETEVYEITESGREEALRWLNQAVLAPSPERDELVIKVVLAAGHNDVDLIQLLDRQRFSTLKAVRELHTQVRDLPQTRSPQRLVLERKIFELEGLLRWLDRVEALEPNANSHPTKEGN